MSLKALLWRSYVGAALVPLLLIELTFLAIYWGTGEFVFDESAGVVTDLSSAALDDALRREAQAISNRLHGVSALTAVFAGETGRALSTPSDTDEAARARYAMTPDGLLYATEANGGAAVYYSGIVPVGEAEREKVYRTERLDPLMKTIVETEPLVTQLYLNTFDSLNRIYPFFDVLDFYPPKMDIPSYNFYYEADAEHNPEGKVVWTDAYIDPAGSGWMVSAIAPVTGPERLEAVVGADVTVRSIVDQVLNIELVADGYAMLVGRDGTLLALPPAAEADLDLRELRDHDYQAAILEDTFKPAEFNLFRRKDLGPLALAMNGVPEGAIRIDLNRPVIASWATIAGTGWTLIAIVGEAGLLSPSMALRATLMQVNQAMLAALILFYLVFFGILWRRSRRMGEALARPLAELEGRMQNLAHGLPLPEEKPLEVEELQRLQGHLIEMGRQILAAGEAKAAFLSAMSHELRTPLNTILGYSELLRLSEGPPLTPERLAHVEAISRAGEALLSVVDGVIALSEIEQSRRAELCRPTPLFPVLSAAVEALRPEAEKAGIRVETDLPRELLVVQSDAALLGRILGQLLSNAVKYNLPGGKVTLRARKGEGALVTVEVQDTGPGIPQGQQGRLFQPFDRLGHQNGAIPGAGVGLAISKQLAALLGCQLDVLSVEGVGSTFLLHIPTR